MTTTKTGKKVKKLKREVPFIAFNAFNEEHFQILENEPSVHNTIYNGVLESLRYAIAENKKSAEVFKLQDYISVVTLPRKDWKDTLENCMNYYANKEDYNKAIECQQLLQII